MAHGEQSSAFPVMTLQQEKIVACWTWSDCWVEWPRVERPKETISK